MIEFEENGVRYCAGKGFARAEKDGKEIWSALDVFQKAEPTKENVLAFERIIINGIFGEDAENERKRGGGKDGCF